MWFVQICADAFTLVQFHLERPRHKWFERSDLSPSQKCFEFRELVFSRSDTCLTRENA